MSKLELTILDALSGTKKEIEEGKKTTDIKMVTGAVHSEGHCSYEVTYTRTTITTNEDGLPKKEKDTSTGLLSFAFSLQNIRFVKQMYSPNEIYAEIQIAPGTVKSGDPDTTITYNASVDWDILQKSLINKRLNLDCDGYEVCNDYYIHELIPEYKKDAMYVTLKMYSPDKMLTIKESCRSYVSKKLWSEIVTKEVEQYHLPYSADTHLECFDSSVNIRKKVNNTYQEHIFPYLVQYNESFYDFLKRTANRWGEFLYYEDNCLVIGYYDTCANYTEMKDMISSRTYRDLTSDLLRPNASGHTGEAQAQDQILNNVLNKGKYNVVKGEINSLGDTSIDGDRYVFKKLSNFLLFDKTIYQFLVNEGVDDLISYKMASTYSNKLNKTFDDAYFNSKNKSHVRYDKEQFKNENSYNEFSEVDPILTSKVYLDIVKKEVSSGRQAIVLDFDTSYPDVKLGTIITVYGKKYFVVHVEGYQPEKIVIENNKYIKRVVDTETVKYKVIAIPEYKESNKKEEDTTDDVQVSVFYPPLLPTGHVRRSGPQLAKVVDADDPLRQNRVRVKFSWQTTGDMQTPWLVYITPASTKRAGIHGRHYVGEPVLVDYENGNIESPYVMGSMESEHPDVFNTNSIVHMTPAGQRIVMGDGTGSGLTAFLASMHPATKVVNGAYPGDKFKFDASKRFEGGIELSDYYGIWSIKGSTNDRNISIKSPWGDVKINAFTGITIGAPNGNVKIQGKNVSIEAGCNLTLKSGINIKQKWFMDGENASMATLGATISKTVTAKVASLLIGCFDLSLLRHLMEIAIKPVEGKIKITAGRYLMLEAGGKEVAYPIDAYGDSAKRTKVNKDSKPEEIRKDINCAESFERLKSTIDFNYSRMEAFYNDVRQRKGELENLINDCKNAKQELQCKSAENIIAALWDNPRHDQKALLEFKGILKDVSADGDIDDDIMKKFLPALGAMAHQRMIDNPDFRRRRWRDAVGRQEAKKERILNIVKQISDLIRTLKEFNVITNEGQRYGTLNRVVTNPANLTDDCLFKTLKDKDDYKKLTAQFQVSPEEKKKLYRKMFIALVNGFGIPRAATESSGLAKPTVFPEPQPTCSDADWTKYCNSIQYLRKKEEKKDGFWSAAGNAFLDPFKNVIKNSEAVSDDNSFGSSKKGEILFASEDGTMVLDRGIYRANVGGTEDYYDDNRRPLGNGNVSRVRNAMLDV